MEDDIVYILRMLRIANTTSANISDTNLNMEPNRSMPKYISCGECHSMDVSSVDVCRTELKQLVPDSSTSTTSICNMENECVLPQPETEVINQKRKYKRKNELNCDGRRQLPARASKEKHPYGILDGTIKKAKKKEKTLKKFSDIKKMYLTKKLVRFHSTNLETIFEEPHSVHNQNSNEQYKPMIGSHKVKRSIACSTGINYSKTILKRRRDRIKKVFGANSKKQMISEQEFLEKLKHCSTDDGVIQDAVPLAPINL